MSANGPALSPRPSVRRTSPWAIAALVCGIVSFAGPGPLAAIPAIICGHKALRQIRRDGDGGTGLAKTGLTLGYICLVLVLVIVLFGPGGLMSGSQHALQTGGS
jgi:hypothetical protein